MSVHEHHVLAVGPGQLAGTLAHVARHGPAAVEARGGRMFGLWKPLIGLSLNHVVVLTEWPDRATADANAHAVLAGLDAPSIEQHDIWIPTLRPKPGVVVPVRPGYVSHRWYEIDEAGYDAFLGFSGEAWDSFEATHASQVLGLWRSATPPAPGRIRMRLMAWYRDMATWEASRYWKKTSGAETANDKLSQRYAMTLDSAVSILEPVV